MLKLCELENNIKDFIISLKDDEISNSSLKIYESNIKQLINYLKDNNIDEIDKNVILDYRTYLLEKKHYKITTINKYIVIINKYLSFIGSEGLKIKQLKYQRKHFIDNVPTVIDYKRILRSAKKKDIVAYYFILIAAYTGMRVSAILEITVESLKESKKNSDYLKIHSKGKYNEVPFPAWLRRELLNYLKNNNIKSGYIFPSSRIKDSPLCRKTMWEKVHRVTGQARVNLEKGHPHAFRHLLGKELTKVVNDDLVVADILGHESLETTKQYQQKSKEEISKIINEFRFK